MHPAEEDALAWNDPTLYAAESARCPCGHVAIDHAWHGCETCSCTRSGIHAAIASGAVEVHTTPAAGCNVRPSGPNGEDRWCIPHDEEWSPLTEGGVCPRMRVIPPAETGGEAS